MSLRVKTLATLLACIVAGAVGFAQPDTDGEGGRSLVRLEGGG